MEQSELPIVKALRYIFVPSSRKKQIIDRQVPSSAPDLSGLTEQGTSLLHKYGLEKAPDTVFFTRKPSVLALLTVLSLGTYGTYWIYRNWKAIRDVSSHKLSPFWRTIFSIFYLWPLFRIMLLQARIRGFEKQYSGGWLATGYMLPGFLTILLPHSSFYKVQLAITSIVVGAISLSMIYLAQQAALFNNKHLRTKITSHSPRGVFEIVFIILGVIIMSLQISLIVRTPNVQFGSSFLDQMHISNAKSRMAGLTLQHEQCVQYLDSIRPRVDQSNAQQVNALQALSEQCDLLQLGQQQATDEYNRLIHKN